MNDSFDTTAQTSGQLRCEGVSFDSPRDGFIHGVILLRPVRGGFVHDTFTTVPLRPLRGLRSTRGYIPLPLRGRRS